MFKKLIGIILIVIGFLAIFIEFQNPEGGGWVGVIILSLAAFIVFLGIYFFKKS